VFYLGGMITYVVIPYQLYTLTGSNIAVGVVGLDHVDRRKLLISTGLARAVLTGLLALNAFRDDPQVWPLYVISFFLAAAQSILRPSKEALLPRTVDHDQLVAANALDSFGMPAGVLVGPAIGGLMLAHIGTGWCYLVDVVGLMIAAGLFGTMASYPHRDQTTPPSLSGIAEGLRPRSGRRWPASHWPAQPT
jgi:MFS family permease